MVEYIDPTTGGPVFKTMTFFVQMLRPGERTRPVQPDREPAGRAVRGPRPFDRRRQAPRLGSSSTRSPCRAAPGASTSTARTREPAFLFVASDEPTLKALDALQEVGPRPGGETVELI